MTFKPTGRRRLLALSAAALAAPALARTARADEPVQLLSHRYPALEFYAKKLTTAVPGTTVDARLMPSGQAAQLERIALSSGASTPDVLWVNSTTVTSFAKSGWLEPLDALWDRHREEFHLDDINPASLRGCSYEGHLYAMPITTNVLLYAYRADLLEAQHLAPPASWDDSVTLAQALNTPRRSGTTISLKWDMPPYELQSVLNTVGDGWFDKDWHPRFAGPRDIAAIALYERLTRFAVPGFTAQSNDENTVNFAQDIAATGQQWATRCAAMDKPETSRVVGRIQWTVPPGGKQAMTTDAYAINRRTEKDKDALFRLLAQALSETNQREAASLCVPPRRTVLRDPDIQARLRWYPAVSRALDVAEPLPALAEFNEVAELATKRMVQAIVGQMPVQDAMSAASREVTDLLTARGYYKS